VASLIAVYSHLDLKTIIVSFTVILFLIFYIVKRTWGTDEISIWELLSVSFVVTIILSIIFFIPSYLILTHQLKANLDKSPIIEKRPVEINLVAKYRDADKYNMVILF